MCQSRLSNYDIGKQLRKVTWRFELNNVTQDKLKLTSRRYISFNLQTLSPPTFQILMSLLSLKMAM